MFPFLVLKWQSKTKFVKKTRVGGLNFLTFIPEARPRTDTPSIPLPALSLQLFPFIDTQYAKPWTSYRWQKQVLEYSKSISPINNKNMYIGPKMSLKNLIPRKQNKLNIKKPQKNNNWSSMQRDLYHTAWEAMTLAGEHTPDLKDALKNLKYLCAGVCVDTIFQLI